MSANKDKAINQDFLVVQDLFKWYTQRSKAKGLLGRSRKKNVKSVDGVSFTLKRGEVLGVIGESGCGKSTLGRTLVRLEEPTGGTVLFDGVPAEQLLKNDFRQFRRMVQIVFQNPFDTFAPKDTIGQILIRVMKLHNIEASDEARARLSKSVLENAGLSPAEDFLARYPHELSGGQLQRISILRSMLLNPSFIVADEPVSMLDVSVRADIIGMLLEMTKKHNASMVFISHDIATTRYISDRVAVMYLGRIVETGKTDDVLHNPQHPYTQALISNCATIDPAEAGTPIVLQGEPPTPVDAGPGCYFAKRCFMNRPQCALCYPPMVPVDNANEEGHMVSCWLMQAQAEQQDNRDSK